MKNQNSTEFNEDLQVFLAEVNELLANTEENLVELEKSSSDSALIQEVFRVMHTIKGGAATLGFEDGVEVTHIMESILDGVRSGAQELTPVMVDVLFSVLDWLEDWKTALEEQKERPPAHEIIEKIREFAPNVETAETSDESPAKETGHLRDSHLSMQLEEYLSQEKPVYKLTVRFKPDTDLLSVRCFQVLTLVNEVADVIGSEPSVRDVEADKVHDEISIFVLAEDEGTAAKDVAGSVQDVIQVSLALCTGNALKKSGIQKDTKHSNAPGQSDVSVKRTSLGRTVRVDVELLDFLLNMVGELVIERTRLTQIASKLLIDNETSVIGNEVAALASHLQRTSQELQEGIMRARLLPLKSIFTKFPRMIRDLAHRCGKQIDLEIQGEDTELDRTVLEAIDDPLIHILRNAVDHGIETPGERTARGKPERGKVILSAWHEENQVLIQVKDDGFGIDAENVRRSAIGKGLITAEAAAKLSEKEAMELIFMPGFSTSQVATQVSGRGVGMDVVRSNLERISGHIEVRSQAGLGTSVTLRLPLTLAIMRALLVRCSGLIYAIPTSSVEEALVVREEEIKTVQGKAALTVRGRIFPLVSLEGALGDDPWFQNGRFRYAILTRSNDEPLALGVDDLVGEEEIVVKNMGKILSRLKGIAGATILAQGDPAIILDINRLL